MAWVNFAIWEGKRRFIRPQKNYLMLYLQIENQIISNKHNMIQEIKNPLSSFGVLWLSQRSWVRIPFKPGFFSGFIFTTAFSCVHNCDDKSCLHIFLRCSNNMIFHIFTYKRNLQSLVSAFCWTAGYIPGIFHLTVHILSICPFPTWLEPRMNNPKIDL